MLQYKGRLEQAVPMLPFHNVYSLFLEYYAFDDPSQFIYAHIL